MTGSSGSSRRRRGKAWGIAGFLARRPAVAVAAPAEVVEALRRLLGRENGGA